MLFDRCHEQRTGGTKAVPGALFDRCREAYRRELRPYLARCLTAIAKRTGGITQSRIWEPFYLWLRDSAWGVRTWTASRRITHKILS